MAVTVNLGLGDLFKWVPKEVPVTLKLRKKVDGKFKVVEEQDWEYVRVPALSEMGEILAEFLEIVYGLDPREDWQQRALDKGLPVDERGY